MGIDSGPSRDELRELVFSARGAIQRLAHVLDRLGEGGEDLPDWVDEAGALSLLARDVEEVPRLLVRIAEYARRLRDAGIQLDPVRARGEESDWADLLADLVLDGEHYAGAAFEDAPVRRMPRTIKDLRNAIEHHADYLAGMGHKPELVGELQERLTHTYTLDPFQLRGIRLFGVEYEVGGAIEVAIQLRGPLDRVSEEI